MRFLVLICVVALYGVLSAHTLSVSPTRIILDDDKGALVAIRFAAESGPVPIELTVLERLPGGALAPAPEPIIRVHPPQLLLEPGEPRSVLIEISGGISADSGRSFYIRVDQLRLRSAQADGASKPEIILLTNYLLPVHILGDHTAALTADIGSAAEGAQLVITNSGTGPALLSHCSVSFVAPGGPELEIDGRSIAELIAADAILPGETIRLDQSSLVSVSHAHWQAGRIGVRTACDRS